MSNGFSRNLPSLDGGVLRRAAGELSVATWCRPTVTGTSTLYSTNHSSSKTFDNSLNTHKNKLPCKCLRWSLKRKLEKTEESIKCSHTQQIIGTGALHHHHKHFQNCSKQQADCFVSSLAHRSQHLVLHTESATQACLDTEHVSTVSLFTWDKLLPTERFLCSRNIRLSQSGTVSLYISADSRGPVEEWWISELN